MSAPPSRELVLPGDARSIGTLRNDVVDYAVAAGATAQTVAAVRLAVSEAATNAVRHAYVEGTAGGEIRARSHVEPIPGDGALLVVAISDDGPGVHPRHDSPGLGLGLPLIAQVTDGLDVVNDDGATVCMRFALP